MKTFVKKNQFAALLIAAMSFTLTFSSCKSGSKNENQWEQTEEVQVNFDSENGLAGTGWYCENGYLLTFTESTYEWRDVDNGQLIDSGDYSIEGSHVYLVRQGGAFKDTCTLEGDELSIGENEDYKVFKITPVG